ncbi:MAG: hypothetical protein WBB34_19890, partial [Xanthobacteraceae bacterium]
AAPTAPAAIAAEPPKEPPETAPAAAVEIEAEANPVIPVEIEPATKPTAKTDVKLEPAPEPIIPLVHAPDDPGPDAVAEIEPHAEQPSSGWRKIFG